MLIKLAIVEGVGQGMPDTRTKKQRKRQEYIDNCIGNELSKTYGIKASKSLIQIIKSKDYKKAAKEILKKRLKQLTWFSH